MDNGTIYIFGVTALQITGLTFMPSLSGDRSAIDVSYCKSVFVSNAVFQGHGEETGKAIQLLFTEAVILNCMFQGLSVTSVGSGAVFSIGTNNNQ